MLAPTHEEEITSLVAKTVKSYKELPLRLYQITRKYRDELRPRHGLLRGREFTMKDLYTFDTSLESALGTYEKVRATYDAIFAEMKLPVLSARASSGDMGGELSHEYHLPTPVGDDYVVHCDTCDYVVNEEIASPGAMEEAPVNTELGVWRGITKDRLTLVNVWYPRRILSPCSKDFTESGDLVINIHSIKSIIPDLDAGLDDAVSFWSSAMQISGNKASLVNIIDARLPASFTSDLKSGHIGGEIWPAHLDKPEPFPEVIVCEGESKGRPNVLRTRDGDKCPGCSTGILKVERALELGHTFHLGTRYSKPLVFSLAIPPSTERAPIQMGCHGIGISRVIGAIAEHMADEKGLNWPVATAPFTCAVLTGREEDLEDAISISYNINNTIGGSAMFLDVVVDDRRHTLPWKLRDADLIGFPIIIVLGREWRSGQVEIQCRQLKIQKTVSINTLLENIDSIYRKLT